jgi:hypothetical protein
MTAAESMVVESTKDILRASLERHGKSIAGHAVLLCSESNAVTTMTAVARPPGRQRKPLARPRPAAVPLQHAIAWATSRFIADTLLSM